MKNADTPAMPTTGMISDSDEVWSYQVADNNKFQFPGLTKRERFAMAAMQGILEGYKPGELESIGRKYGDDSPVQTVKRMAYAMADSMLDGQEV